MSALPWAPAENPQAGKLTARWYFTTAESVGRCRWPTSIYEDDRWEVITDLKHSRIIYRPAGDLAANWQTSTVPLHQSHSVTRLADGRYLIADTDDQRLVVFGAPDTEPSAVLAQSRLAGLTMLRPHDALRSPADGFVYVIDSHRRLYRMKSPGVDEQVWEFAPADLSYDRALSFFDGHVHIINSAAGEVLRIDDFAAHRYTRFRSFGKKITAAAGSFPLTGFVLNDVEKWDGWYYGTNYFTSSYARGTDTSALRLLRWRNWDDFAAGRWEDLSSLVPEGLVPYFLTAHGKTLFVAVFDHEQDSGRDGILEITASDGLGR